jgi:hypothetical protein
MSPWIEASLPNKKCRAKKPKMEDAILLTPKFLMVLKLCYVVLPMTSDVIKSMLDYLHVLKAKDIRPVYNRASCGMNEILWAPNLWLSIGQLVLRILDFVYFLVDINLGEFLFNFPCPDLLIQYSGIDLVSFMKHSLVC